MKKFIFISMAILTMTVSGSFAIQDDDVGPMVTMVDHVDDVDQSVMVAPEFDIQDVGTAVVIHRIQATKSHNVVDSKTYPQHDVGWMDQPANQIDQPPSQREMNGTSGGNPGWRV